MKARKLLLAMMTIASVMLFNACEEDPCKDVTCSSNGTPVESLGSCSCDCDETTTSGYYGNDCESHLTCLNGGTFVTGGTCTCLTGYEGDSCQIESRAKFLGTFSVVDACSASGGASYTSIVAESGAAIDRVLISNFWDSFTNSVIGTINGSTITIATQEPDGDGFTVTGTGTISGNIITMNYSVTDTSNGDTDVCQSTWTKQ